MLVKGLEKYYLSCKEIVNSGGSCYAAPLVQFYIGDPLSWVNTTARQNELNLTGQVGKELPVDRLHGLLSLFSQAVVAAVKEATCTKG